MDVIAEACRDVDTLLPRLSQIFILMTVNFFPSHLRSSALPFNPARFIGLVIQVAGQISPVHSGHPRYHSRVRSGPGCIRSSVKHGPEQSQLARREFLHEYFCGSDLDLLLAIEVIIGEDGGLVFSQVAVVLYRLLSPAG